MWKIKTSQKNILDIWRRLNHDKTNIVSADDWGVRICKHNINKCKISTGPRLSILSKILRCSAGHSCSWDMGYIFEFEFWSDFHISHCDAVSLYIWQCYRSESIKTLIWTLRSITPLRLMGRWFYEIYIYFYVMKKWIYAPFCHTENPVTSSGELRMSIPTHSLCPSSLLACQVTGGS